MEDFPDDVVGCCPEFLDVRVEDEPVPQEGEREVLQVFDDDVVSSVEESPGLRANPE